MGLLLETSAYSARVLSEQGVLTWAPQLRRWSWLVVRVMTVPLPGLRSPITTHMLDTAVGNPAEGVRISLQRLKAGTSGACTGVSACRDSLREAIWVHGCHVCQSVTRLLLMS